MAVWATQGVLNSPSNGTILADTGPLPQGEFNFKCIIATESQEVMRLEVRNVANTSNVRDQVVVILGTRTIDFEGIVDLPNANQRIRVVMVGSGTGRLQASIISG